MPDLLCLDRSHRVLGRPEGKLCQFKDYGKKHGAGDMLGKTSRAVNKRSTRETRDVVRAGLLLQIQEDRSLRSRAGSTTMESTTVNPAAHGKYQRQQSQTDPDKDNEDPWGKLIPTTAVTTVWRELLAVVHVRMP